jgi:signal transduction histidine kinase
MAVRWRIRHKLLLGLGVVVGIIALLLLGTLQGLAAFTETVKTADSKIVELHLAENLKRATVALLQLKSDANQTTDEEEQRVRAQLAAAREALAAYEPRYYESGARERDLLHGGHEAHLINDLKIAFAVLDDAIAAFRAPSVLRPGEGGGLLFSPAVQQGITKLDNLSGQLRTNIAEDLFERIAGARKEHRRSLTVVLATSALGVVLMAGLLRFFYNWVFHPIRDLQASVARVARGDFSQPIILNSQDELQELAEAFNDMTAKLRATYDELSRQVSERGNQLVRSERLASVGYLAAGVAHEINNPLASIAFCAEGLERRLADLLRRFPREQETITKYLKMIQQEAFRCKSITQGLLEFSRVGEGQRQPTDLSELIQSVLDMVQHHPHAQDKKIVFRPAADPVALANPQEIKQVVLNIVVNALESMDVGGTLTIALSARGPAAEIDFSDTGCGMDPTVIDRIFEPFFTANRTGKGTGLGLSISQRIVTQHGGEIEASSFGPGRGSTFVVRLPLAHAAPAVNRKEEAHGLAAAA